MMELVIIRQEDMVVGNTYHIGQESSPFIFTGFSEGGACTVQYPSSRSTHDLRSRLYFYEQSNQSKENTMAKLYEINTDGAISYGSKLATDSSGNWVMELKGSNKVVSVHRDRVTEVLPYTVGVKFNTGAKVYSYLARTDDWAVGDIVVVEDSSNPFATITAIDSKSTAATKWLVGIKIKGEFIKGE
jgi:hypothetical protein